MVQRPDTGRARARDEAHRQATAADFSFLNAGPAGHGQFVAVPLSIRLLSGVRFPFDTPESFSCLWEPAGGHCSAHFALQHRERRLHGRKEVRAWALTPLRDGFADRFISFSRTPTVFPFFPGDFQQSIDRRLGGGLVQSPHLFLFSAIATPIRFLCRRMRRPRKWFYTSAEMGTLRDLTGGCYFSIFWSPLTTSASGTPRTGSADGRPKWYGNLPIFPSTVFLHARCTDRLQLPVVQVVGAISFDSFSARVVFCLPGAGQQHRRRQSQPMRIRSGAAAMCWSGGTPPPATWDAHHVLLRRLVDLVAPPGAETALRTDFDRFETLFSHWRSTHADEAARTNAPGSAVALSPPAATALRALVAGLRLLGLDPGVADSVRSFTFMLLLSSIRALLFCFCSQPPV
jgi:hypothetical protein